MNRNRLLSKFQFPSNGKAYLNRMNGETAEKASIVSIPFKRESISERRLEHLWRFTERSFNSLQTGKHIWTRNHMTHAIQVERVSIPFKRESISEPKKLAEIVNTLSAKFQFPSNGKAYLNPSLIPPSPRSPSFNSLQTGKHIWTSYIMALYDNRIQVSIPFKRESISERNCRAFDTRTTAQGFNSLQTGKHIWTL